MTDSFAPTPPNALVPVSVNPPPAPLPDFMPVPVRPRLDGWTAERQRAFIEHLADHGDVLAACAHVGMSERSAYALRNRPDADTFNAAWVGAIQRKVDTLVETAVERAIKGTLRGRYWKGELIAEERVPSDRLLVWLIERGRAAVGRARTRAQGHDSLLENLERLNDASDAPPRFRVWQDNAFGKPYTNAPPPPRFKRRLVGEYGQAGYYRELNDAEWGAWHARQGREAGADEEAARRAFFGLPETDPPKAAKRQAKTQKACGTAELTELPAGPNAAPGPVG